MILFIDACVRKNSRTRRIAEALLNKLHTVNNPIRCYCIGLFLIWVVLYALMSQGITDSSLKYHIQNAKNHGVTQKEIAAIITHVAFYAGWPKAWAVFNLAKEVYEG